MTVPELRTQLEQQKGRRDQLLSQADTATDRIRRLKKRGKHLEKAQAIIQVVARSTQQELEYHISELVSLALEAVFPDPYKLDLSFELKRGRSEAVLSFVSPEDGGKIHPLSAAGGGVVDVAAFALRVALYSLQRPKTRATLILDEPFRFLSRDLQLRASAMLKEISERLKLQIILVSHDPNIIESADKTFTVKISKGVSKVEED